MISRAAHGRPWRLALFAVATVVASVSLGAAGTFGPTPTAEGMMQAREAAEARGGTPVAATAEPSEPDDTDPLDGDPLDGDPPGGAPLDREPPAEDPDVPTDQSRLEIARSGRPNEEPRSLPAYDADPTTLWTPEDSDASWVWFDLGEERRVREVRWLALGAGAVEIALSSDRRRWRDVDRVNVDDAWQGITLRDDTRYVRLRLLADDEEEPPALAEVAVYGPDRGSVSAAQEADDSGRERRRGRSNRDDESSSASDSRRNAENDGGSRSESGNRRGARRSNERARISAQPGETRCGGDRERCEARQGEVTIEEDCAQEGSCTIDVQADGGDADCDATGGDDSRAGDGEDRRGGEGGRCEAAADGGAVAIGDINP